MYKNKKGFTLLEILLLIALIGILIAILLVSINPNRQLSQIRNLNRKSDITNIYNALEAYSLRNSGQIINGVSSGNYQEICNTGVRGATDLLPNLNYCEGKVDLRVLVPAYIAKIPKDNQIIETSSTGYEIAKTSVNQISIKAKNAELGEVVAINPINITTVWAEGGDNVYSITVYGKNYRVHEFTTPGTANLNVIRGGQIEYLIVGGGGGSGFKSGIYEIPGGGGKVVNGNTNLNVQTYNITVGEGGAYSKVAVGGAGGQSSAFSIIAEPGLGGGGLSSIRAGSSGAGFVGGLHQGCGSGGGAGAGGDGGNAIPTCGNNGTGGSGGIGIQSNITGTAIGYGGGGGGASWNQGCALGSDGGGWCGCSTNFICGTAIAPSRGGGGGASQSGSNGIVIIRYES